MNKIDLITLLLLCSFALATREMFSQFKAKFNKEYVTKAEEMYRFKVFLSNLERAHTLNTHPNNKAVYGITQFMDLTPEEFANTFLTYSPSELSESDKTQIEYDSFPDEMIPDNFDWVQLGATTPVYDQAQCGSCWAFSATETIESFWYLAGNPLTKLSMQQLVSCDHTSFGCNGGWTRSAYRYVIKAGGIESFEDYPYSSASGVSGRCAFDKSKINATISSWSFVTKKPSSNETLMQQVAYTTGPLSVCVDASTWQFYRGGVVSSHCEQELNHCVQLTGWGFETSTKTSYWIVRNSWGTRWGEKGFIWIEIGQNLCGIADDVTIVHI